ncbi:MAG: hypothetical protein GX879_00695 [Bacteroidales bacterium]|nr:hypothetical protein [Bacteroidales bacterium]
MKKLTILCLCLALGSLLNAQIIALHHEGETQIFNGNTAFVQAYEASQAGDTLYFSGGTYFPPSKIDIQLTLFGAGHYQDSTLVTGKTIISGSIKLKEGANNFYIEGIAISDKIEIDNNSPITGLSVKRCYVSNGFNFPGDRTTLSSNIAIIGSIFGNSDFINTSNVLVSNSIISRVNNSHGNQFRNNIMLASFIYTSRLFNNSNNNFIANSIIKIEGSGSSNIISGDGNQFYNNVFNDANPSYGSNPTLSDNIANVNMDDVFVNQTGVDFDYSHDYHLQDDELYLGTDGTQVGIYGGIFPYKEGAVPINPHFVKNTTSNTTNDDGDLPVRIIIKAQKDKD